MLKKAFGILKKNSWAALLILAGSLTWSLTMVKSGLIYDYGMGFWGPNGHDGIWHIALIKSLVRGSWEMPVFAGEALKNYHVGYDFLLAWISKLTGINPITLYFQIIPPILALSIGVLSYKLVLEWQGSKAQGLWAIFFIYFGGSFGWIVNLIRTGELGGESMFWAQQGISTLLNPPFALSLIVILLGLIYLKKFLKKSTFLYFLPPFLLFGILIQIKAYAGILSLGGLLVSGVFYLIKQKKLDILLVFLGSTILSVFLFLPLNSGSQGLLVFQPFWFLETMMGLSDRVGWDRFYSAMTNYRLGGIWFKSTLAYLVAFAIFWFGNLGTRAIGGLAFLGRLKSIRKLIWVEVFTFSLIVAGVLLPMFFLQKGTPWNTIQFIYYSLFFSGIMAGIVLGRWAEKFKTFKAGVICLAVVLLTVPTTLGSMSYYLPTRPPSMIPTEELEALEFLALQPSGIVLTYPFDSAKAKEAEKNPPRPLYLYESTAYVSALADKSVYLEDQVNLDITGYKWGERRNYVKSFLESSDDFFPRDFLRQNNISYVYWIKGQRALKGEGQLGMSRIFENDIVEIYMVD